MEEGSGINILASGDMSDCTLRRLCTLPYPNPILSSEYLTPWFQSLNQPLMNIDDKQLI